MTSADRGTVHAGHDPSRLAGAARSILACPAAVNLVVDGVDDVLADVRGGPDGPDSPGGPGGPGELGMQDLGGVPTFSCPLGTRLGQAARECRRALLTLESGLGPTSSDQRHGVLTLGGQLESRGRETCECCAEVRDTVVLVVDLVVLTRPGRDDEQLRVPIDHFRSGDHVLNRGFLQRSSEHANHCHQDELRRAVSTTTGTRLAEVVGVSLLGLSPAGVEIQWVDPTGSHTRTLRFPRVATSTDDLGDLLRSELHAGLC